MKSSQFVEQAKVVALHLHHPAVKLVVSSSKDNSQMPSTQPSSSSTSTGARRSPLRGLKRSYATRGSVLAANRTSKRPRLHHSLQWVASGSGDESPDNKDGMCVLVPPGRKESDGVYRGNNNIDEESLSDDEHMNSRSSANPRSRYPHRFHSLPRSSIYNVPYTDDCNTESDTDHESSCCSACVVSVTSTPSVHFVPSVVSCVVEIPSHRCYTPDEKAQIWNSPKFLRKQAKRNRIEWLWEGCHVDHVAEEHQFVKDPVGKLLHPAHCVRRRSYKLRP